ncbi:MAG: ketoacyl-ACP synthase III [Candidatus Latescibacteria bacterium]|nr:ketoacyl-ACP synthase III [Candidatus Latescibacterota bacterium]
MKTLPRITGLGFSVPSQVWDNHKLEKMVDTSDEWIQSRTGIVTRCIAGKKDTTASLASEAALKALDDANCGPLDVDIIIVATMSPEMLFPATACFVQEIIGAKNAAAFDITAACTGFIYGLTLASSMVLSGAAKNVLVIGAETLSRIIDWTDRNTCVLFGDGAGAALVSNEGKGGQIIDSLIGSDGSQADLLYMPGGGSQYPTSEDTVRKRLHFLKMADRGLFKVASVSMANVVNEVLVRNHLAVSDIDLLIPHQANLRIILATAKKLDLNSEKAYVNINKYGNTSAATIPIAMVEARDEGLIAEGKIIVLVAFGSGMTWGATILKY